MTNFSTPASGSVGSTSTTFITRLQAGEPDAWERLASLYGPLVYQWARRLKLREHDAADVVQEVFRAVAAHVQQFSHAQPGESFRGWLWTITRNKVHDHFRRLASRPEAAGGTEALFALQQIPDAASAASGPSLSTDLVRRALDLIRDEFEPHTWQAFWRSAVEGHSTDDIARDLNMQKPAVRQAKYRILQRLRRELS